MSLISDKFTPYSNEGIVHPLGYSRRMKYMMNTKELARLTVIKGAIDGVYTAKQAARKLDMSVRWVKHLKKAVREQGEGTVIHGNAGRHPANATDEGIRKQIIALKKSDAYRKANFTHFRELLAEREQITISYASLSGLLKGAGVASSQDTPEQGETGGDAGTKAEGGRTRANRRSPFEWRDRAFSMPCTGFRMTRPGTFWGCICANMSVSRGISRRFGPFYRVMECLKRSMRTK
jgi:transposase